MLHLHNTLEEKTMNYVKQLSLALLVISGSSFVFAGEPAAPKADDKSAPVVDKAAPKTEAAATTVATSAKSEDVKFFSNPWTWYRNQGTTLQVAIPAGIAAAAVGAYCFIPEVKKATHKAIDKTKAFVNDLIEPVEGSTSRRNAAIVAGLGVVALAVVYRAELKKALTPETAEQKKAREEKEAVQKAADAAKAVTKADADKDATAKKDVADKDAEAIKTAAAAAEALRLAEEAKKAPKA